MGNRVYLSYYQAGHLDGVSKAASVISEVYIGRDVSLRHQFFSAILQAGVTRLYVADSLSATLDDIPLIQSRLTSLPSAPINDDYNTIVDVFRSYLPPRYEANPLYRDVWTATAFLADLCVALRHDLDLIFPGSPPEYPSLAGLVPPELLAPLSTLFDAIRPCSLPCPIPRHYIDKRNVAIFREVLESLWFEEFCKSHEMLSDASLPLDIAIPAIREKAYSLLSNFDSHIQLGSLTASLLPALPQMAEDGIEKLPKGLSSLLLKGFERYIESRRRIVIYDSNPINEKLFLSLFLYATKNKDKNDIVEKRLARIQNELDAKLKNG